jgi:hypothetical protein
MHEDESGKNAKPALSGPKRQVLRLSNQPEKGNKKRPRGQEEYQDMKNEKISQDAIPQTREAQTRELPTSSTPITTTTTPSYQVDIKPKTGNR